MTTRKERARQTREKIVRAAEELLKVRGFAALNVDDITKIAGVAKGTFYVYFPHKTDVVEEICRGYFQNVALQVRSLRDADIAQRLGAYAAGFMKAVQCYGIHICREWIRSVLDPACAPEGVDRRKWRFDVDMLRGLLEEAVQGGELKPDLPVDTLTHLLISQLYGMMLCWCISDNEFRPEEWSDRFSEFQLRLILAPYMNDNKR
ncbi:MAG: TetR/AcrR family transcriptional regulator [Succinivibrionaceae bacterium]|nr:TetR/AcrR family transcriptional regulator [Succinivibrionaceae bacterium]